jgi:hypothetical protein
MEHAVRIFGYMAFTFYLELNSGLIQGVPLAIFPLSDKFCPEGAICNSPKFNLGLWIQFILKSTKGAICIEFGKPYIKP